MSPDSLTAGTQASGGNVVAHRSIRIRGRHCIVCQLNAKCLLGAASSLKNRAAVRTKSARTIANHGLGELQTIFISNTPPGIFFFDGLLEGA